MAAAAIVSISPLAFPWEASDPFLFCAHHDDAYPAGNGVLGPKASLAGRDLGQDFEGKDGWRMYHGQSVPGFPAHPHRGFETVTVVRRGLVDHSDSLGATARYGQGDVQWLTAGRGIVHSEMFPLVDPDGPNPLELFQIWLNLPAADKLVAPHFTMHWAPTVPVVSMPDDAGRAVEVVVIAGRIASRSGQAPPPASWAAREGTDVAIWTIRLATGARWTLPPAAPGSSRSLYFFRGAALSLDGVALPAPSRVVLRPEASPALEAGPAECELLLLQGKPIGEPVSAYGPFVMNTAAEIRQAFADYQRTRFGGWPWPSDAPVLAREEGRVARHPDGRIERAA